MNNTTIKLLANNLKTSPNRNCFLNFGEKIAVNDFTGKFMLLSETLNVGIIYCYLFDNNKNLIANPEDSNNRFFMETNYDIPTTAKYITIYGLANEKTTSIASIYLATGLFIRLCLNSKAIETANMAIVHNMLSSFTDGRNFANVFVKELYIDPDAWDDIETLTLIQARNNKNTRGPIITIGDKSSYDETQNLYKDYFIAQDCLSDVIEMKGTGKLQGKSCYIVVNWDTTWEIVSINENENELEFFADINRYTATHIKFSPFISQYLRDHNTLALKSPTLPECEFKDEQLEEMW